MANKEVCPGAKKCPYYWFILGKCFTHCDLTSDKKCGNCAHWTGYWGIDKRNESLGGCVHYIGDVDARLKTDCPHYTERKPNELNYYDWVENFVTTHANTEDEVELRKIRIQGRKEWIAQHN